LFPFLFSITVYFCGSILWQLCAINNGRLGTFYNVMSLCWYVWCVSGCLGWWFV